MFEDYNRSMDPTVKPKKKFEQMKTFKQEMKESLNSIKTSVDRYLNKGAAHLVSDSVTASFQNHLEQIIDAICWAKTKEAKDRQMNIFQTQLEAYLEDFEFKKKHV